MKHRTHPLILVAVLCGTLFAACQKEDDLDLSQYKTIITVKSNDAKTHYNAAERSVEWDTGDHISVVRGNSDNSHPFADFKLIDVQNGVARFGSQSVLAPHGNYHAIYPAQENLSIDEGVLTCTAVRHDQTLAEGSFGHGDNTAVGCDASTTMQFRNVCGLAKIALRGTAIIKSIKIASNSGDTLSGRGTIDLYSPSLKIHWEQDASPVTTRNEVVATSPAQNSGVSVSGGRTFYLVLPPCTLNSYTITVTDVYGNQHSQDFTTPVTIARTTVTSLGAFDVSSIEVDPLRQLWYTTNTNDGIDPIYSDEEWLSKFSTFVSDTYDAITGKHIVTFNQALTAVPWQAFYGKSALTSIHLPDSVTSIGSHAFCVCSSLASVNIPSGVTSIDIYAFCGCSSITSIALPSGITTLSSNIFDGCTNLASVTIQGSVTSIGNEAFYRCTSLTYITIPSSVTSIGRGAFRSCNSLTYVTLPNTLTSIGEAAFMDCFVLDVTYNGTSAPTFGDYVFSGVRSDNTLHLPSNISQTEWNKWDAVWPGAITPSRPE